MWTKYTLDNRVFGIDSQPSCSKDHGTKVSTCVGYTCRFWWICIRKVVLDCVLCRRRHIKLVCCVRKGVATLITRYCGDGERNVLSILMTVTFLIKNLSSALTRCINCHVHSITVRRASGLQLDHCVHKVTECRSNSSVRQRYLTFFLISKFAV